MSMDIPGDISTTVSLAVGTSATSIFQLEFGDTDFFRVQLVAGTTYEFTVSDDFDDLYSIPSSNIYLYDSRGILIDDPFQYDYRSSGNTIQWAARTSGTYYLGATNGPIADGTEYTVALQTMNSEYFESLLGTSQYYFRYLKLESGFGRNDELETLGDIDRFQVRMRKGRQYVIEIQGEDSGMGTLVDPDLILHMDGQVLRDYNSGTGHDSRLIVTASSSGSFDLLVRSSNGTGTYKVIATEVDDFRNGFDTTYRFGGYRSDISGTIGGPNDVDWFKVQLTAGQWYQFDLTTPSFRGLATPALLLRGTEGSIVQANGTIYGAGNPSSSIRYFAETSGTYHVIARSWKQGNIGDYRLSYSQVRPELSRGFQSQQAASLSIPDFLTTTLDYGMAQPISLVDFLGSGQVAGLVSYQVYTPSFIYRSGIEQARFQIHEIPIAEIGLWTIRPQAHHGVVQIRGRFENSGYTTFSRWQNTETYNATPLNIFGLLDSGQYWDSPITIGRPATLPSYYGSQYTNFQAIADRTSLASDVTEAWQSWRVIDQDLLGGGETADINIFVADGVTGYFDAFLPGAGMGGDIVLNSQFYSAEAGLDLEAKHQLLVAIGYALGFNQDIATAPFNSVMSGAEWNSFVQSPTSTDLYWMEQVYGNNYFNPLRTFGSLEAPEITSDLIGQYHTYRSDLQALDSNETIDFSGADPTMATNLDMRAGGYSYLQQSGGTFALHNGLNVLYRDLIGTHANDTVVGNGMDNVIRSGSGHDYIDGGFGNDFLVGSAGNDTYVFSFGTGDDTASEFEGHSGYSGTDSIKYVHQPRFSNGRIQLEQLFVFQRHGDDLTINLTLDESAPESTMTIQHMGQFNYRVEKMNLSHLGQELSLVSLYNQLSDGETRRFKLAGGSDSFGQLVTPAY